MSVISTCFGCKERTIGCHSTCERYIEQSKANTERREQEFHEREIRNRISQLHNNRMTTERPGRKRIDYK